MYFSLSQYTVQSKSKKCYSLYALLYNTDNKSTNIEQYFLFKLVPSLGGKESGEIEGQELIVYTTFIYIYRTLEVIFPLNDFILVSFKNDLSHKYLISLTITNDRVHL